MRHTFALLVALLATFATHALAQGVTELLTPSGPSPAKCTGSRSGSFQINVQNVTHSKAKRGNIEGQADGALEITLNDGVLKDSLGRTGCIVANRQFQFDGPPQAGVIYTGGWSMCANGSLAMGGSTVFYQCLSGTFFNLYDQTQGEQCNEIYIAAINAIASTVPVSSSTSTESSSQSSASPKKTPVSPTPSASPTPVANGTNPSAGNGTAKSKTTSSTVVVTTSSTPVSPPTSSPPSIPTAGAVPAAAVVASQGLCVLALGILGAIAML